MLYLSPARFRSAVICLSDRWPYDPAVFLLIYFSVPCSFTSLCPLDSSGERDWPEHMLHTHTHTHTERERENGPNFNLHQLFTSSTPL